MIFVLDNYDSFTYNLVQYAGSLAEKIIVERNDRITPDEVISMKPEGIIISPGPKSPSEAGISRNLIRAAAGKIPVFGVCLGHQAIAEEFGGKVVRAEHVMHGKTSMIRHHNTGIFKDLPDPFRATRYHSLIVEKSTLPDNINITAESEDGTIMGIELKNYPNVYGVQFHPESILTEHGMQMMKNFMDICHFKKN